MPVFVFCLSKRRIKRIYCVGACRGGGCLREYFRALLLNDAIGIWFVDGPIFLGRPTYYRLWFYYSASIELLPTKNIFFIKKKRVIWTIYDLI